MTERAHGRAAMLARTVVRSVGAALFFVCALPLAVWVHAGTPAMNRLVVAAANRALAGAFRGKIEVASLRRFGLDGVEDAAVAVRSPQGRELAAADGVTVRIRLPALAWAKIRRGRDVPVVIDDVYFRSIDATLVTAADGETTLAQALAPRHPSKTTSPARIEVRSLRGQSVRVRGRLGPIGELCASASAMDASFWHDDRGTAATVRRLDLTIVGFAPQPISTSIRGDLTLPASGSRQAAVDAEGWIGDVPLTLAGALHGDQVDAQLDLRATDDALRGLAPSLAIGAPASAHVEVHGLLSAAHVSAWIGAAGGTMNADADVRREGAASAIRFEARATVPDLARVPFLHDASVRGSGTLESHGRVALPEASIDAELELRVLGARVRDQALRQAVAHGRVRGALASPLAHLTLVAEGVKVAGHTLDRVAIDADGPVREPEVRVVLKGPRLPEVRAHAALDFRGGLDVRSAGVVLTRDGARLFIRVDGIHLGGGNVDATGIEIESGGQPLRGEAHVHPHALWLRLSSAGMDLDPVLRMAGATPANVGPLALDVDVRADGARATGHLNAGLDVVGLGLRPSSARVMLKLTGRRIDGEAKLVGGDLSARATLTRVVLGGPLTEEISWRRATGAVSLDCDVPLASLRKVLRDDALGLTEIAGDLSLRASVARQKPDGPTDLAVEGALMDRWGTLLRFDADSRPTLLETPRPHASAGSLLERTPLRVHVDVPNRDVSTLPPGLRPVALDGRVEAWADLSGEMSRPRVRVHLRAQGLRSARAPSAPPVDGVVEATYDGRQAHARALLTGPEGVVLDARSNANVVLADLFDRGSGELPWDAGATAVLHEFPLEDVLPRALPEIGGLASGVLVLDGLHRDAHAHVDLRIRRPSLGAACFEEGWLRLSVGGEHLVGTAGLERPGSSLATSIRAAARWGSSLVPAIEAGAPIDATLEANDFRAAALMPLLRGPINKLDGRIDANASVHVNPDFQTGTMIGNVRFTEGVLEVPALGERLHGVTAVVSVQPWGTLRVDGVTASGSQGHLRASAKALLEGLKLRSATADLEIEPRDRMPLTVEGVSLGEASGSLHAEATMSPDQKTLDVLATVPKFDMRLSQATGRSVQSLEPAQHIVIGRYEPYGRFVALPMHAPREPRTPDSLEIRVDVELGRDVRVRRDATLDLQLTGKATIDITDAPHVSGAIRLVQGSVDVFGKRFTIDPASELSFTGDPNNPQLVVTASYDAPDSTHIYADVTGPVKKPNVVLSSEPPRSQDAILGLLLFGSEEGLGGAPAPDQQPDPMQRAAGVASGPVAEALNKALSGITSLEVTTRVDTSQAANPRPEVALRVTNDVLARVTVQTGMPAPGELPDRTLLTVDWRFSPRWSLESTVGDEGSTSIDLLWHHRY